MLIQQMKVKTKYFIQSPEFYLFECHIKAVNEDAALSEYNEDAAVIKREMKKANYNFVAIEDSKMTKTNDFVSLKYKIQYKSSNAADCLKSMKALLGLLIELGYVET